MSASRAATHARWKARRIPILSRRERDILALMAKAFTNKQIADALFVSDSTIRGQIVAIYANLGIGAAGNPRVAAVLWWQEHGNEVGDGRA